MFQLCGFSEQLFECECVQEKYYLFVLVYGINSSDKIGKAEAHRQSKVNARARNTKNVASQSELTPYLMYTVPTKMVVEIYAH
jgi:hypothetical protein